MTKIVDKMTVDLDRIEALISESLRVALHIL
jgi:hypothetical protein